MHPMSARSIIHTDGSGEGGEYAQEGLLVMEGGHFKQPET